MTFFMALGFMLIVILLFLGVCYWIWFAIKKYVPNLRYMIKYQLFKKKYNEEDVERLMEFLEEEKSDVEVITSLLVGGEKSNKAEELSYIYNELKKLKGGENK